MNDCLTRSWAIKAKYRQSCRKISTRPIVLFISRADTAQHIAPAQTSGNTSCFSVYREINQIMHRPDLGKLDCPRRSRRWHKLLEQLFVLPVLVNCMFSRNYSPLGNCRRSAQLSGPCYESSAVHVHLTQVAKPCGSY